MTRGLAILAAALLVVTLRAQLVPIGPAIDAELERDLQAARADLDTFWRARVQNYTSPDAVVMVVTPADTDCGRMEKPNAMYCRSTNKIYWDANFFMDQFKLGDFAPLFILGHEWGHLVQHRLGFFDSSRNLMGVQLELQADCMSGFWAADLLTRGRLDERDDDEAVAALRRTGGLDRPWFEPKAHGTPGQRIDSFLYGYQNRDCREDAFFKFLKDQLGIDASRVPQTPTPTEGALAAKVQKQAGRFAQVSVERQQVPGATDYLLMNYRTPDGVQVQHGLASFPNEAEASQRLSAVVTALKQKGYTEVSRVNVVDDKDNSIVLGERVLLQGAKEIVYWNNRQLLGFTEGPKDLALELFRALPY